MGRVAASMPGREHAHAARRVTAEPAERSLWHYLGLACSAAALLLVLALAAAVVVVPKLAGAIPLTVLTNSMAPGLPPGTLVVVAPVDPADLRIGSVATYQVQSGRPGVITHRIIEISTLSTGERSFVFQGDNNSAADPTPILAEQIQGRVWYSLPLMGFVNTAVSDARGWLVPVGAALLFAYCGYMVTTGLVAARRPRRAVSR